MPQVRFGNTAPVSVTRGDDEELVRTALDHADADAGESVTEVEVPEGASLVEAFTTLTAPGGVWDYHSDEAPSWVSSDSKPLADLLAEHFGCEVRKHDTKVVTAHGNQDVAKPAAHRAGLAGHAQRLGVKGSAVDAEPGEEG